MKFIIFLLLIFYALLPVDLNGQKLAKDSAYSVRTNPTLDTIYAAIERLQYQNVNIASQNERKINQLNKSITNIKSHPFDLWADFFYPFILSIISAIVFWIVFSYAPERKRKRRLRPKLELDIYNVYSDIFSIFDLIMRPNSHSPSSYQSEIRGNKLTKENINLRLHDKCLNQSYLYDASINENLIVIGKELYEKINRIDLTVERLFNFSNYLSAEEILLLEEIRKNLQIYTLNDYNREAGAVINGKEYRPVNPSLSYMSNSMFDQYVLFNKLQSRIFNSKFYSNRNIVLSKVQHYFYSEQYKKCKKCIMNAIPKYPNDKLFLQLYFILSLYHLHEKEKAFAYFEELAKQKIHLISYRNTLRMLIGDKNAMDILYQYYSKKEIAEFISVIEDEAKIIAMNNDKLVMLNKYYDAKAKNI